MLFWTTVHLENKLPDFRTYFNGVRSESEAQPTFAASRRDYR